MSTCVVEEVPVGVLNAEWSDLQGRWGTQAGGTLLLQLLGKLLVHLGS